MSSRSCAREDGDEENGQQRPAYADASCSEEDSSVMDSDDLRLRQQQQRRQDRRDQQLESEYEDDEEIFDDDNEEEEEEENLSRNPSSSTAHASMQKLQSSLQIHDNSLGRCMHEGDDEGRPPAAKRPRTGNNNIHSLVGNRKGNNDDDNDDGDDDDDDDDDDPPPQPPPPPPPPPPAASGHSHAQSWRKLKRCWLCTFANCKMAKQVSEFVSTNAGVMDPSIMAEQIRQEVSKEYPRAKGIGKRHIMRHIREHMLVPGVRMAGIVRSLISLAETLRCTLQQVDDDTGDLVVDIRNTELYLKVCTVWIGDFLLFANIC